MRLVKALFFAGDVLLLNAAVLISANLYRRVYQASDSTLYLLIYSNLAWLFLVVVSNPYHLNKAWTISKIVRSQFSFLLIHMLAIVSLNLFFKKEYSVVQVGAIYLIFAPLFFLWKTAIVYVWKAILGGGGCSNYIIVGRSDFSYQLRKYYLSNPDEKRRFCGYFDASAHHLPLAQIQDFCVAEGVHEIYCCVPDLGKDEFARLVSFGLESLIRVRLLLPSQDWDRTIMLESHDAQLYTDIAAIPLDQLGNKAVKRLFDLVFALLVILLILSWLTPLLGLLIVLDSPGPVFFVQHRNGKDNNTFNCIKFRTMIAEDATATLEVQRAVRDDPRITRLGNFLRKTSLDELPQFINVLLGSMSVVGPRPMIVKVNEKYHEQIDRYRGRHYIKPGITGLAQCLGYRGAIKNDPQQDLDDMIRRTRMDLYYIENWSLTLDAKIIFRTVISLIREEYK